MERRTYADRKNYLAKATNIRRTRLKKLMVEYKGGKCQLCDYSKYIGALDFHHIDPSNKRFGLSMDEMYRSWEEMKKELDKCVMVCSNCHREIHGKVVSLDSILPRNTHPKVL